MNKKILIIVHTEYHMLWAISIIADYFKNDNIHLIQSQEPGSNRFLFDKNLSAFDERVKYTILENDESDYTLNTEFVEFVNCTLQDNFDKLIVFNRLAVLDFYLIKKLSKKGTEVILCPDGAAAYCRITAFTPRWSYQLSLNTHRYLRAQGFRDKYIYWPTLRYGMLKEIKEIWVQYPSFVDNRGNKLVKQVEPFESEEARSNANLFFGHYNYELGNNVLFYLNQPFRNKALYDFEIKLLNDIRRRYPDRKMIIKLHPSSSKSQVDRLREIGNIELVENTLPAELIIANLKNAIIFSFWSTALLIHNSSCTYYWLYPMLVKNNIMLYRIKLKNPTRYIKEIDSLEHFV